MNIMRWVSYIIRGLSNALGHNCGKKITDTLVLKKYSSNYRIMVFLDIVYKNIKSINRKLFLFVNELIDCIISCDIFTILIVFEIDEKFNKIHLIHWSICGYFLIK